jgi:hypothetical protein
LLINARECRFPPSTDFGTVGVVTAEDCANNESPALLNASTRYTYVVLPETVLSVNAVTSAPRSAPTCVKLAGVAPVPRNTRNPVSLLEASVQVRLMAELDATVAWRFEGAAGAVRGGGWVVALATFDAVDSPELLNATTRYAYVVLADTVLSVNAVAFAPRSAPTCVKLAGLAPVPLYTLNPVSLLEVSLQARFTAALDAADAWRFEGAAGAVTVLPPSSPPPPHAASNTPKRAKITKNLWFPAASFLDFIPDLLR